MRILFIFIIPLVVFSSCDKKKAEIPDSTSFMGAKKLGRLKDKRLDEASGLVASISNPGLLWVHNDGNNPPNLFLVDTSLNVKMVCALKGVENRDWEDIAIGPGPVEGKSYLYVGEIGDNNSAYRYKRIYRLEEPQLTANGNPEIEIADFSTIVFQFEKRKDSETLMIDPVTKDLYLVSKRERPVVLYSLPYPQKDTMQAVRLCELSLEEIVGGDFSASGDELLLKNYQNVYYWKLDTAQTLCNSLRTKPAILVYEEEPQGESIAFARDGSGYYTLSEKALGQKIYLRFYQKN